MFRPSLCICGTPYCAVLTIHPCICFSGLSALTKVLISSERKVIPANLHYEKPNPNIAGLLDGRLQVVSRNSSWNGGLAAINSFGFGGTNVHSVINTGVAADKVRMTVMDVKLPKESYVFIKFCFN